jgi:hypothetical protein
MSPAKFGVTFEVDGIELDVQAEFHPHSGI